MTESQHTRDISASTMLRLAPPLEVKLASDGTDEGFMAGYASVFGGKPDLYGDVIAKGAYAASLADHKAAGTLPIMLWSHDLARPVGRWVEVRKDDRGLYVQGKLNLNSSAGQDAFAHLKAGDVTGLSIGFKLGEGGYEYRADGVRVLTRIDLAEISVVAMPAARAARGELPLMLAPAAHSLGNDKGARPGQGRRLCLKLTASTDVDANGFSLPRDTLIPGSQQDGRSEKMSVAAPMEAA